MSAQEPVPLRGPGIGLGCRLEEQCRWVAERAGGVFLEKRKLWGYL